MGSQVVVYVLVYANHLIILCLEGDAMTVESWVIFLCGTFDSGR